MSTAMQQENKTGAGQDAQGAPGGLVRRDGESRDRRRRPPGGRGERASPARASPARASPARASPGQRRRAPGSIPVPTAATGAHPHPGAPHPSPRALPALRRLKDFKENESAASLQRPARSERGTGTLPAAPVRSVPLRFAPCRTGGPGRRRPRRASSEPGRARLGPGGGTGTHRSGRAPRPLRAAPPPAAPPREPDPVRRGSAGLPRRPALPRPARPRPARYLMYVKCSESVPEAAARARRGRRL